MAAFFYIHGGANTNFSTVGNWSGSSGGASNGAAPTTTSDCTFDGVGTHGNDACVVTGTITVLSLTFTSGYTNTITINTAVTLGIGGNFTDNTAHSWTVSGTGLMAITATSTITSGGKTFPGPVTFNGAAATKTLVGDWTITGALTVATNAQIINHTTAETLNCGGLTVSQNASGTALITLTGGTWSGGSTLSNSLTFAGSSTVSGSINYATGTITWSSGTITTTGSTISISVSCTFATSGMSWNNITLQGTSQTYTINSLLSVSGILTIGGATSMTFAGSAGFSVATLTSSALNAYTHTLVHGVTYTVTTAFNCFKSTFSSLALWTSDDASVKAVLTLQNGASCNVMASFTRIDASNGRTIWTFNGTVTTCNNIFSFTDALPPSHSRIIQAGGTY